MVDIGVGARFLTSGLILGRTNVSLDENLDYLFYFISKALSAQ